MGPRTAERRIFRRIEGEVPVQYSVPGTSKEYRTFTKNISGGGIRIPLFRKLAPGTVLSLKIFRNVPNISAKCKGEIRWVAEVSAEGRRKKILEAGIKFLDLSFLFIGNLIGDLESQKITSELQSASAS